MAAPKKATKTKTTLPETEGLPNIGKPATRALAAIGVTTLAQVRKLTEPELLQLHGVGPKAVRILRDELEAMGKAFRVSTARVTTTPLAKETKARATTKTAAHPMQAEIDELRKVILGADPSIREGFKWNAPSFYTTDHFATLHLRAKDEVSVILHLGAKAKKAAQAGIAVVNPKGILEWLAQDRARVTFKDRADIRAKKAAFQTILRSWMTHV